MPESAKVARLSTQIERWKRCFTCDAVDAAGSRLFRNIGGKTYCMSTDAGIYEKIGSPVFMCPRGRFGEEKAPTQKRKLILESGLCAGDIVALLFAVESLCQAYPGEYIVDVRTQHPSLFEGCPHIKPLKDDEVAPEDKIEMHYKTIDFSNQHPYRFINGYREYLEQKLGVKIPPAPWNGFLRIREEEQHWFSAPRQILGQDVPYWVLDAGYKTDYTAKQWEFARFQEVVSACPDVTFVQIGAKSEGHVHPELKGTNLISLVGQTDLRQLIRLVYNSFGVITPVSLPMMLAFAVPPHPRFRRLSRACIVLAGGREPNHWHAAANHQFLHSCGMLPCCDNGGCWMDRVIPLKDDVEREREEQIAKAVAEGTKPPDPVKFCQWSVKTLSGQVIGKCMDMITADDVVRLVRRYQDNIKIEK